MVHFNLASSEKPLSSSYCLCTKSFKFFNKLYYGCFESDFNLSDSEMATLDCQFQSRLTTAPKDCQNVLGQVHSNIGCDSNVVHIMSTLVSFDYWVQLLAHETWKSRHRFSEILCKSFLGKSSASKNECKHFHWPLVRHLQTVVILDAV